MSGNAIPSRSNGTPHLIAIHSPNAPKAVGPYSQAIAANGFIFCSGQLPLDPASGQIVGSDVKEQTRRVFENLKAILRDAGTDLSHAVKTTVFLKNIDDFGAMNDVYATFFGNTPPARSAVEVARLPRGALVKIELIAAEA